MTSSKMRQIYVSLEKLNQTLNTLANIHSENQTILSLITDYKNLLKNYDYIITEFKNE